MPVFLVKNKCFSKLTPNRERGWGSGRNELCSEEITLSEYEIIKFLSKLGGTLGLSCYCRRYVNTPLCRENEGGLPAPTRRCLSRRKGERCLWKLHAGATLKVRGCSSDAAQGGQERISSLFSPGRGPGQRVWLHTRNLSCSSEGAPPHHYLVGTSLRCALCAPQRGPPSGRKWSVCADSNLLGLVSHLLF